MDGDNAITSTESTNQNEGNGAVTNHVTNSENTASPEATPMETSDVHVRIWEATL